MEPVIIHRKRVFVGSLPHYIGKPEIQRIFEKYGTIKNIVIHEKPGQTKYAFVIYTNSEEAMKALVSEQSLLIDGKKICVATGYSKVKQRSADALHRKRLAWLAKQKRLLYALNRSMRHYTDSEFENMSSYTGSLLDQQDTNSLLSSGTQESAIVDSRLKKLKSSGALSKRKRLHIPRSRYSFDDSEYENVSSRTESVISLLSSATQENVIQDLRKEPESSQNVDEEREITKLRSIKRIGQKTQRKHLNKEDDTVPPIYLPTVVLSRIEPANLTDKHSPAGEAVSKSIVLQGTSDVVSQAAISNSIPSYPDWTQSTFPNWTQSISLSNNTSQDNIKQEKLVLSSPLKNYNVETLSEWKPQNEKYVFKFSLPLYKNVAAQQEIKIDDSFTDEKTPETNVTQNFELDTNRATSANVQEIKDIFATKLSNVCETWNDEVKDENTNLPPTISLESGFRKCPACSYKNNNGQTTCISCRDKLKLLPQVRRKLFRSSKKGVVHDSKTYVESSLDEETIFSSRDVQCDIRSSVDEKDNEACREAKIKTHIDAETQTTVSHVNSVYPQTTLSTTGSTTSAEQSVISGNVPSRADRLEKSTTPTDRSGHPNGSTSSGTFFLGHKPNTAATRIPFINDLEA